MTVMSAGELTVNLQRDGCGEPFGFRLRGGTDIREAFIIQRVKFPYFPISILIFNTIRLKSPKIIEKMWQILWVLISYFKEMGLRRGRERESGPFPDCFFFLPVAPQSRARFLQLHDLRSPKWDGSLLSSVGGSLSLFLFLAPKLGPKIKYSFGWSAQQSTVRYGIPSFRRHVDLVLQAGPVLFFLFFTLFFVGQHSAGHLARVLYYQRPLKDRGPPFMPFSINTSY